MKSQLDTYRLSNGVEIPCIGFGTWQTPNGDVAVQAVQCALESGYRHIDTAAVYGNEASVGKAIRTSGVRREELFVTTKLWNNRHSYDQALKAFDESMDKLGLDYLDLYLIHWPNPIDLREGDRWIQANAEAWRAMEELYEAGRIRAIGISNFRVHHMEALLKTAKVVPHVNQIRLCPGDTQDETVAFSRAHGMLAEAYSPLGIGRIFEVPEMQALAQKYGRSIAQHLILFRSVAESLGSKLLGDLNGVGGGVDGDAIHRIPLSGRLPCLYFRRFCSLRCDYSIADKIE